MAPSSSDDLLSKLAGLREKFETRRNDYLGLLGKARSKSTRESKSKGVEIEKAEDFLECYSRLFLLDDLLVALGWNIIPRDDPKDINVIIEKQQKDPDSGNTKFLDYVGYDRHEGLPVVLFEAKSSSKQLPPIVPTHKEDFNSAVKSALVSRLNDDVDKLGSEWSKWIDQLQTYIRSLKSEHSCLPKKVVISNGDWLVIFKKPSALLPEEECTSDDIVLFENFDQIQDDYEILFAELDYSRLVPNTIEVESTRIRYDIDCSKIDRAMKAIVLLRNSFRGLNNDNLVFDMDPVFMIRFDNGRWVRVKGAAARSLKFFGDEEGVTNKVNKLKKNFDELQTEIEDYLGSTLSVSTIESHYSNNGFAEQECVQLLEAPNLFLLLTGRSNFILKTRSSYKSCGFHEWSYARECKRGVSELVETSSAEEPRSFFCDKAQHHCCHVEVYKMKNNMITKRSLTQIGKLNRSEGASFCSLWKLDHRICCRTCILQSCCSQADVFKLDRCCES